MGCSAVAALALFMTPSGKKAGLSNHLPRNVCISHELSTRQGSVLRHVAAALTCHDDDDDDDGSSTNNDNEDADDADEQREYRVRNTRLQLAYEASVRLMSFIE